MSEKDEPTNGGSPPDPDAQEQLLKNQWEQMMQNYAKSGAMSATAPFMSGAMPFPMHFPQAYMFPMMPYAGMQFYPPTGLGADIEGKPPIPGGASQDGSLTEDTEGPSPEAGSDKDAKKRGAQPASGNSKKWKSGGGMGVKTNSQAALALLASTANGVNSMPTQSNMFAEMWGQLSAGQAAAAAAVAAAAAGNPAGVGTGSGTPGALGTGIKSQSRGGGGSAGDGETDDDGGGLDEALLAGMDEREIKKLRRKQSNRESARRSRLRKQAECEQLAAENKQLHAELQLLRNEKIELKAQVEILQAKLAMSTAFGSMQQPLTSIGKDAAAAVAAGNGANVEQPNGFAREERK